MNSLTNNINQLAEKGTFLFNDNVINQYDSWESPNIIVSDGAYYANENGRKIGKPYFSIDGIAAVSKDVYAALFPTFNGKYGITNVWDTPPLHSKERVKLNGGTKYFHLNQKPLKLMELIISSSSYENDVIWEPFGGLFSASLAAHLLNRKVYASEIDELIFSTGVKRFADLYQQQKEQLFEIPTETIFGQYATR